MAGCVGNIDVERDGALPAILRGSGNEIDRRQGKAEQPIFELAVDGCVFLPFTNVPARGDIADPLDLTAEEIASIDSALNLLVNKGPAAGEVGFEVEARKGVCLLYTSDAADEG